MLTRCVQMFIRANEPRKKHTEYITEYFCGVLALAAFEAFEACRRKDVNCYINKYITVLV